MKRKSEWGGTSFGSFPSVEDDPSLLPELVTDDTEPVARLCILPIPYLKIMYYAQASPGEISGFCKTRRLKRKGLQEQHLGDRLIVDVKIFRQTVSQGDTVLGDDVQSKFLVDLIRRGENPADWNVWWHSHHNFGVFWSGTDEQAIAQLSAAGNKIISLVVNKMGDMKARQDKNGIRENLRPVMLARGLVADTDLRKRCTAEVRRKVTLEVVRVPRFNKTVRSRQFEETELDKDYSSRFGFGGEFYGADFGQDGRRSIRLVR